MQWLNTIIDELVKRHPDGEILVESGASPSGTYHLGHLREPMIADVITRELRRRGREARHVHFVDDLDALRKIPHNVPGEFEQYLGKPLCDIPAPDGSSQSYADYFLQGLEDACDTLGIDVEFIRSHEKYRSGWHVPAIERALDRIPQARQALQTISGRQLDEHWSPIQVMDDGRLKNRRFLSIDTDQKTLQYEAADGSDQSVRYDKGEVKLDWRLDWPARWWLLNVACEPSGRDHVTKGSSYDTGVQIMKDVFEAEAPLSVAYDFINMAGDTKKMSASKGTGLDAMEVAKLMPPEVMRFFVFRAPPLKRLYFDPVNGVVQLMDEFAAFAAREDRSESEEQLLYLCTRGVDKKTVSRVPFSLLVASYQAALKDPDRTLAIIGRTEHAESAKADAGIIKEELKFIDAWLEKRAPQEVRFELSETIDNSQFTDTQRRFLATLADKIAEAPEEADGSWFHQTIYEQKDTSGLAPKELFVTIYQAVIGKDSGPRAGWFLSILPRDWLVKRLRLEA
ncbi:MAG TPA: lysine--tRNA ligase [Candidatus Saccharimonadales bacterium]|nr:lysine--tRNA ligase [Candidatus Saccharimonadales bacterium]